ncbi:MAG TPA: hypothetical protein VNM37_10330, partial [Candidatus Dormibacteraeota bacterium]|nr:hypothetical protein [Candidatus Dormibacteraeota bacterium]
MATAATSHSVSRLSEEGPRLMREDMCIHWDGVMALHKDQCRAGVLLREADGQETPGLFRRVPCFAKNDPASFACPVRQFPTPEEVAKADADFKVQVDAVMKVMEAIGKAPKGGYGTVPCPKCGGTISWVASSYNGHRHAACETPDCIQVME